MATLLVLHQYDVLAVRTLCRQPALHLHDPDNLHIGARDAVSPW
ncbi:hypothetical protein [Aeromonas cavernicola]|nr:hypothetical protein [Aeromonas cavernicola]